MPIAPDNVAEWRKHMLKDEVFYSPTRREPYSVREQEIDRSRGVLAAQRYLETRHLPFNRIILNVLARIVNWVAK